MGDTAQVTVAVTGAIEQLKLIAELYPFNGVTVIVLVVLFPAAVVYLVPESLAQNSRGDA